MLCAGCEVSSGWTLNARTLGRLRICYRGRAVAWEEIPGPVSAEAKSPREATAKKPKPPTPKADHPWRQDYRKMRPWGKPGQVPLLQEMSG